MKPENESENRRELLLKAALGAGALMAVQQTAQASVDGPIKYASWIHGHTGHIGASQPGSRPPDIVSMTAFDTGLEINLQSIPLTGALGNRVHYGIPTPVILSNVRLNILRVILNFATEGAQLFHVSLYDGPNHLFNFPSGFLSGDHPFEVFELPPPPVQYGIGVSFTISAIPGTSGIHRVFIRTVGADFG